MGRFTGLLGILVILGAAWLFSSHKRAIKLRIVGWGLGLQFAFAVLVLKTDFGKLFQAIGAGVNAMLGYTEAGSAFVFGDQLGRSAGPFGVIFAFQVLPIIIFIASFFAILYYLGIMQWIVRGMAIGMQKVMGVSGAESLNVAASIFMGQTEAPLTIRPFLAGLTESELFTIMASGMAHVSGSVMAAYVKIAGVQIQHLLTAVIMTAPATIMLAKIFIPEIGKPVTAGKVEIKIEKTAVNVIDAAAQGAGDGLHLALNIGGMLIAFLALIAMANGILGWVHGCRLWAGCRYPSKRFSAWCLRRWPGSWACPGKMPRTIGDLLGDAAGPQRIRGVPETRADEGDTRSAVLHHRDLCALRIRQLQFHRHPDRRHRCSGAESQVGSGAAGAESGGGGNDGEFHVGLHRRNVAVMEEARQYIESRTDLRPAIGVVLGSGLGAFADELTGRVDIPYAEIPGWPTSTAVGHAGKLILGKLGDLAVAVMSGRAHLYEGNTQAQATYGVRVLGQLGVKAIVFTNAAGGINLTLERGGLVLISDHINLQGSNPLVGPNDDRLGPRFPDMSDAYAHCLREVAKEVATELCIPLSEGVYAAMLGPSYETPAEIRFLRTIGADVVGMSTVPEVIVANHMGIKALGISCVTNMAAGILPQKINHEEVLETGAMVRDTLVRFLKALLPRLAEAA